MAKIKLWDTYTILGAFLSFLINDDPSSLTPEELSEVKEWAGKFKSPIYNHEGETYPFSRCEITGLYGQCEEIQVYLPTFRKVRFMRKGKGATAGLVMQADKFDTMSVSAVSRLFPASECMKMQYLQYSPELFEDDAYAYDFETATDYAQKKVNP